MNTKLIGLKEFRQNMAKIANQALKKNQKLIVLRKNQPIFELRPLTKQEKFLIEIEQARGDFRNGRFYTHEQVKKMLGL